MKIVKIKSRSNILNDVIRDAKKYPKGWKAVIGKVIAAIKNEGFSPKEIIPIVTSVVKKVNNISLEELRKGRKEKVGGK